MNAIAQGLEAEEQRLLAESAAGFSKKALSPARLRTLRESGNAFDRALWQKLSELGWTALLVPEEYGGLGLTLAHMTVILEELGKRLLPEPLVPVSVLSALVLAGSADEALKRERLPALAAGDLVVALAWQEDVTHFHPVCASTATASGDRVVLDGTKRFVRPGAACDAFIVAVQGTSGIELYWVPHDTRGLLVKHERSADGSPSAIVHMDGASVPARYRLAAGAPARELLDRALDAAAIATAAELLGLMRGAFDATLEHVNVRTQFGKKIGSFQALQHRLVDLYIQIRLSAACVAEAARNFDTPTRAADASRAKSRCSDAALLVTREAIQMHGAIGFTDEHDIGLYLNRALVLSAWLGNGAEHRQRFAALTDAGSGIAGAPQ